MVLGLDYERGDLREFNEDEALRAFETLVKGKDLLDKKLVSPELLPNKSIHA